MVILQNFWVMSNIFNVDSICIYKFFQKEKEGYGDDDGGGDLQHVSQAY
jgi:hypothetical protein